MNKAVLLFLQLCMFSSCDAQHKVNSTTQICNQEYDSTLQRWVYTTVDKMPEFEKGEVGLLEFFKKNFRYPENQDFFQGSINLVFIVDNKGLVTNGHILKKSKAELTLVDKEALRVLSNMPRWKAGSCEGRKVPVRIFWPVRL
ncbi:energy transducer TonB [Chitinophaga sp. YIM B06452]|uniref:energy transducer TonB n=1 Tax=Chitinophaga sp. YIM B06452 TaxID=3082158 RepID=UPI0031FF2A41